MKLPRVRLSVRQVALAGGAGVVGLGVLLICFSRPIGDRLFGPLRYPDIRFDLPAGAEMRPLPPMEPGEWEVWIEFSRPIDFAGANRSASLVDLDSNEVTDVAGNGRKGAEFHTSGGQVGVGIGGMRVAGGRRYGLRFGCEGERCKALRDHRPTIVIMAPPGPRKSDTMRVLVQQLRVASAGFLLVVVGSGAGLATTRVWSIAAKSASGDS